MADVAPHADVLLRSSDGTVVAYEERSKRTTEELAAVLPDGEVLFPPRRRFSRG